MSVAGLLLGAIRGARLVNAHLDLTKQVAKLCELALREPAEDLRNP